MIMYTREKEVERYSLKGSNSGIIAKEEKKDDLEIWS